MLYARRPGYQSQFSPLLQAQTAAEAPFAALIDWMQENLDQPLDVPALAARAGLSERSFYRKFTEATGKTPAHFVEGAAARCGAHAADQGPADQDDRRQGRAAFTGAARPGLRTPLRHGAVMLFREITQVSIRLCRGS